MTRFSRWPWKPRVQDEVDDELTFHIEMRTRELIERGLDPHDARREAERRLGNIERVRAVCRWQGERRDRAMRLREYFSELRQDAEFTWRQMWRNRGLTVVSVVTLALGIGGTTAIFSAVYAVVLKPLPLADPSRLVIVSETFQGMPAEVSAGNYVDTNAVVNSFEGLAAQDYASFNLSGTTPERIIGARVTANFFDVMGSRPIVGRVFNPDEDRPGNEHVVVLSHRLWLRRFGGAPMVGRDLRMNGTTWIIIGIMPASFDLATNREELWVPIAFTPERKAMHDEHYLEVYGRLKAGRSRQQAQADLNGVAADLRARFPRDDGELSFGVIPFSDQFVGEYRLRLFVLLAAVALVLLIACGNVANLLLARGVARGREIAIRAAVGAGMWRIVRQLLTESVVLALASAAAGIALAKWSLAALIAWAPANVPRLNQAQIDPVAVGFAAALALASSVVFGLAPALRLSRADVQTGLRDGGRGATGGGFRDRLRSGLMAAEVALSLLLLFGAGLLIRSAIALQRVDPGFDPTGVLSARVSLPRETYVEPARIAETFRRMAEVAAEIHGVTHAAVSSYAAMGPGGGTNGLFPEGRGEFALKNLIQSTLRIITPDYFRTMRVPIVRGRGLDDRDRPGGQKVMIVSQALAVRAFPGQDPIGKRIACCESGPDNEPDWKIVVGVAGDVRSRGPAVAPGPEFYLPLPQVPTEAWGWIGQSMYILARTEGDPAALGVSLRAAVARLDPDLPVFDMRMMDQRLQGSMATARFNTVLLSILGGIGLILAASGIYGVIAYFVSQRTQEIGVRIALGATPTKVIRLIVGDALKPIAIGAAAGLAAALAASRVLVSQLFGVSRTDPLTMVAVLAGLFVVAFAASAIPARRAAAVDPTRALQAE